MKGIVTLDGQPLGKARVTIEPENPADKLDVAVVTTADNGEFEIAAHPSTGETLRSGKYVVTVSRKADKDGKVPSLEEQMQLEAAGLVKETIPGKYSAPNGKSELKREIKPGKNELKLDLVSK